MPSEVRAVGVGQARQRFDGGQTERRNCVGAKSLRNEHLPIISEADHSRIECGVPERREQQAIVHIEAEGVSLALGPRHDVRGTEEGHIRDTRQTTATVPVFQQGFPKYSLANALHNQAFGLRRCRNAFDSCTESLQGRIGQADAETITAIKAGVKSREDY
jgi:hypothetical protein